mmetsp:Transcript_92008/g.260451  ORF Transcript_92008/g.260451 Transcript_92008/m.260451 type:complete len:264 (-) Transcript_92008:84-875(-)
MPVAMLDRPRETALQYWRKLQGRVLPPASTEVILHVYDVGTEPAIAGANRLLRKVDAGAYHAAVEVNGREWSYGYVHFGTGVFSCGPAQCYAHTYREAVHMGHTRLTPRAIKRVLRGLEAQWRGRDYDLLRQNCCHFCDALCVCLGVGQVPTWLTNLSNAGLTIADGVENMAQRACKVAHRLDGRYDLQGKAELAAKSAPCCGGCAVWVKEFLMFAGTMCEGQPAAKPTVSRATSSSRLTSMWVRSCPPEKAELICHRPGGVL